MPRQRLLKIKPSYQPCGIGSLVDHRADAKLERGTEDQEITVQVHSSDIPDGYLISEFAKMAGYHTDAFYIDLPKSITLEDLIFAFYTTPLFKAERWVLRIAARAPSTDVDARALASAQVEAFAVWHVELRTDTDILLADQQSGRTKSWLAVEQTPNGTRAWFGSVVVPVMRRGKTELGPVFTSLMGLHGMYSRALLGVAARRVLSQAA